jgi:hypothetical protein
MPEETLHDLYHPLSSQTTARRTRYPDSLPAEYSAGVDGEGEFDGFAIGEASAGCRKFVSFIRGESLLKGRR